MSLSQFANTLSVFNNLVSEWIPDAVEQWRPALAIHDQKDKFVIECELPGLVLDDVLLEVSDGVLEISGERKQPALSEGATVRVNERITGRFCRRIRMDDSVDREAIVADYRDGVLVITAPKVASTMPRSITVNRLVTDGNGQS
jgi:HSP20 family protein